MLESFALGHGRQGHFRNCSHKTTWYDLRLAPYLYWSWKTWLLEALLSQVHMTWSDISFPCIWLRKTDCNRNQLYRSTCYGHTSRLLSLNCQRIKKKRCMLTMSDKITWSSLTCFSCEIVLGSRREHMWPKCLSRLGKRVGKVLWHKFLCKRWRGTVAKISSSEIVLRTRRKDVCSECLTR